MADPITLILDGRVISDPEGIIQGIRDAIAEELAQATLFQQRIDVFWGEQAGEAQAQVDRVTHLQTILEELLTRPGAESQATAARLEGIQGRIDATAQKMYDQFHPAPSVEG